MGDKVGEKPVALRAAVFFAILEKPGGGGVQTPPPPAGRGLRWDSHFNPRPAGPLDFTPPAGGGAFERPPPP